MELTALGLRFWHSSIASVYLTLDWSTPCLISPSNSPDCVIILTSGYTKLSAENRFTNGSIYYDFFTFLFKARQRGRRKTVKTSIKITRNTNSKCRSAPEEDEQTEERTVDGLLPNVTVKTEQDVENTTEEMVNVETEQDVSVGVIVRKDVEIKIEEEDLEEQKENNNNQGTHLIYYLPFLFSDFAPFLHVRLKMVFLRP